MVPRIHLAIDNCFASKRWTRPAEWMEIAADAGVVWVEASADTESDPLYTPPDVLDDWVADVQDASQKLSVRVCNLYSGHGTYTTLGLSHPDSRVRDHIQHRWLEPMIRRAGTLGSGLGFYCHAFSQATLADPRCYAAAVTDLTRRLGELARYAAEHGVAALSVEQMYAPHQIPWTIAGATSLLKTVYAQDQTPLYITIDTGHQVGQSRFLRPSGNAAQHSSLAAFVNPVGQSDLEGDTDDYAYLFAEPQDASLHGWLEALGLYSPIIHLQQTDGTASAHRPFTARYNQTGIVSPPQVLRALYNAYRTPADAALPPRCADLYLTLEIFSGTADRPNEILSNLRESVAYWRAFIPQDGLPLDTLVTGESG